jgi:hypothetical protein
MSFDLESDHIMVSLKSDKSNPFEKFNSSRLLFLFFMTFLFYWFISLVTLYHDGDSDSELDDL